MLVHLTPENIDLSHRLATERELAKARFRSRDKRVSRMDSYRVTHMGIAGEIAVAQALEGTFDPSSYRGGDGHKGDVMVGNVSISVKTRQRGRLPDFIFPHDQDPDSFHDDYGVLGIWQDTRFTELDLVGYFTKEDCLHCLRDIRVGGSREGIPNTRRAIVYDDLRPIRGLLARLKENAHDGDTYPSRLHESG